MSNKKRVENRIEIVFNFGQQYHKFLKDLYFDSKLPYPNIKYIILISMNEIFILIEIYKKLENYFNQNLPLIKCSKVIEKYTKEENSIKKFTNVERFDNQQNLLDKLKRGEKFYLVNDSVLKVLTTDKIKITPDLIQYYHLKLKLNVKIYFIKLI